MSTRAFVNEGREERYLSELRDKFAGQVMAAQMTGDIGYAYPDKLIAIAEIAYRMADAMLKVRIGQ